MVAWMAAAMMMAAPPGRGQDLVTSLRACSAGLPGDKRLACYDRAAAALLSALDDRSVAVVDHETVHRMQKSLFGFVVPKLTIFGLGKSTEQRDEEISELRGVARTVHEIRPDHFEIVLEDGAVWKNIDPFREPPQPGDTIAIVKAALGSFFMTVGDSKHGTRCARVR